MGRRKTGRFLLKNIYSELIHSSADVKKIQLIEITKNYMIQKIQYKS